MINSYQKPNNFDRKQFTDTDKSHTGPNWIQILIFRYTFK